MTQRMISIALWMLVAACGKKDGADDKTKESNADKGKDQGKDSAAKPTAKADDGACPVLTVMVDGKPVEGKFTGQAVTAENSGYQTQMVELYNHDKYTCDEALKGRHTPVENEVYVKAFHGVYPGVGIDAYTHLEGKLTLDKPPAKVGEPLEICVRKPIEFTPNAGAFNGKKVSIVGKFSGVYCGVWKS
jgi:hypothetical protein